MMSLWLIPFSAKQQLQIQIAEGGAKEEETERRLTAARAEAAGEELRSGRERERALMEEMEPLKRRVLDQQGALQHARGRGKKGGGSRKGFCVIP